MVVAVAVAAVVVAVLALEVFAAFQWASPCHPVAEAAEKSVIAAAFAVVAVAAAVAVEAAVQDLHSYRTAPSLPLPQEADQALSCLPAGS